MRGSSSSRSSSSTASRSGSSLSSLQSIREDKAVYGHLSNFMVAADALHGAIDNAKSQNNNNKRGGWQQSVNLSQAAHEQNKNGSYSAELFLDLLEAELARVTQAIASQLQDQELSAKALLANVDHCLNKNNNSAVMNNKNNDETETMIKCLRQRVQELTDLCLKLQLFVTRNADLFKDVAARADAELGGTTTSTSSCTSFVKRRLAMSPWKEGPNSALIVVLSDIYEDIRKLEAQNKEVLDISSQDKWIAPSAFERSTTKYWVKHDKLTQLLLACVAEAPLLVYGKRGRLTAASDQARTEGDKLWDRLATPISSVYFDSAGGDNAMCLYKERLRRSQGSQLFRIRWYGDTRPRGNEIVFLELKTHHEKWTGEKSVKERVNLQEKNVCRFLSPEVWSTDLAKKMVLGAEPSLTEHKLEAQVALLQKMRQLVLDKNLRPCVRSMYNRAAFQSPTSNALRLTLDRNVTLIDETQQTSPTTGSWCLPDDAVIPSDRISHVPYPVFEVKLYNFEMPSDLQKLIDSGTTLIEAPKFSKYLTGAASFNASRVPGLPLPYWADEEVFCDVFNKSSATKATSDHTDGVECHATMSPAPAPVRQTTATSNDIIIPIVSTTNPTPSTSQSSQEGDDCNKNNNIGSSAGLRSSLFRRRSAQPRSSQLTASTKTRGSSFTSGRLSFARSSKQKSAQESDKHAVMPNRRVKVEPKSFFANERTFIQWISAALLLVTISVILLDFSTGNNVPSTAGIFLNVCAVIIVFYAMFAYYRRLKLLQSLSPYGYIDHFGPMVLASAVILGVLTLLYYYVSHTITVKESSAAAAAVASTLTAVPGACYQRPTSSMSSLEYQPSGVVVDKERDILLVPSLDRITALSMGTPDVPIATLITIPGADLEALTYAGDRIFALGEGEDNPILFELKWNFSFDAFYLVQQWVLETSDHGDSSGSAEGLVFIPDANNPSGGSLYVAGDHYDSAAPQDRGVVYIYDLPPASSDVFTPMLKRKGVLNSNMLNLDLIEASNTQVDSKIGDLHYADGILYVLHDNVEVIRAWNATSGELLGTTRLPRVAKKSSSRQWEGMALERIEEGTANPSLRGAAGSSPASSLVLHLALDTPPQVWSFAVSTDERGSIVFPPCAATV